MPRWRTSRSPNVTDVGCYLSDYSRCHDLNNASNPDGAVSIHTISLGDNLTITSPAAPAVTLSDVAYYVQSTSITLTYSGNQAEYCQVSVSPDATVTKNGTEFSFILPAADVTATASIQYPAVTYIDADGTEKTAHPQPFTGDDYHLDDGWYVVNQNVTITKDFSSIGLTAYGDVHLILADSCTLSIGTEENPTSYGICGSMPTSIIIYGQHGGTGKLLVRNKWSYGIYASSITINGGIIDIHTDGEANGSHAAIQSRWDTDSGITFNGGQVHLSASNHHGIDCTNINLNYRSTSDRFYTDGYYYYQSSTLTFANGKAFTDEDGNLYSGTYTLPI